MPSKYIRSTKPRNAPSGRKLPPTGTDADLNLVSMSAMFADEDKAREFIESKRWPDGKPVCPHCGCKEAYALTARKLTSKRPMRKGVYKCKECRKQFTVRMGTIFEESKLPLRKWLMAMHLISSKKGVSARQISREVDCTITTAWFLMHRVRECMTQDPLAGMLSGVVEADEVWVGGKPRHHQPMKTKEYKPGRRIGRSTTKQPVLVLVERDGNAVCHPLPNCTTDEISKSALVAISQESVLMTDDARHYISIGQQFSAHHTTNHSAKEYGRRENGLSIHSNTAESFIALLRRGHYGVYHQISKKHLFRYCNEFRFRWDARKVTDGQRMVAALAGSEGKRLTYRSPKVEGGKSALDENRG